MLKEDSYEPMYPKLYIDLFRSFERSSEVFVAMSFEKKFDERWSKIFRPAIKACKLKPFRLKESIKSDSIPTRNSGSHRWSEINFS